MSIRIGLMVLGLIIPSMVYSQSKNVSIHLSNVTVAEAFDAIRNQSGYTIAYNDNDVNLNKKVTVHVKNKPVEEAVRQALVGQNVVFVITGNHIVLSKYNAAENKNKITGTTIPVRLFEDTLTLNEVVITALGIRKKEKSLTYSTQIVDGEELIRVKDPNLITSLAGKTAGVQINKSASGLGGSAKVIIRGNRSAAGNNQPLYVIDGIPINNTITDHTVSSIGGINDAGNRDGGDGISNLNPDDIESLNILKGPAAAALYGSQAANGVVVITTKKGKVGKTAVTFNTATTWNQAVYGIPEFQNNYTGMISGWGSAITGSPDYTGDFFKTGITTINSLSVSSGSEKMQTYFSYAHTYGKGVLEHNDLTKHNFNFRETAGFFENKVTLDANINLLYQNLNNEATPGGYYNNPLVGLYHFPRGSVEGGPSFDYYKTNYQLFDESRSLYTQNWYTYVANGMEQNPYWLINKIPSEDRRIRGMANLVLTYKINRLFSLQARGNADFIADKYNQKMYVGTATAFTGENGRYITYEATHLNTYGDILLTYQDKYGDNFALNIFAGGSISDEKVKSLRLDSRPGSLYFPNVFTVANMHLDDGYVNEQNIHTQDQSLFFAGQLAYRDVLFLDVTARNEWTSTLAFTTSAERGFFYPSVGLSWIINESFSLPEEINLGKIRGAWAQVGNGLLPYISNLNHTIASGGNFQANTTAPFDELKPENTESYELGTEWRLFNNRIELDFTYYKTNTINQLFRLPATAGSGYSYFYINAGNIENKGMEMMLGGSPVWSKDYRWKTAFNFATNQNKVLELDDRLNYFAFGQDATHSYQMRLEKGGSFGDIYGMVFQRDEKGDIVYNQAGLPVGDTTSDLKKIANCTPKWNLGWSNTLVYKDFSLFFLIDGRFGGEVLSVTQADLDAYGVSKVTGDARKAGQVFFDGKTITDVASFYQTVGGRSGITEYYVYDATNIRLRELSLAYNLPEKWLGENGLIKSCAIALTGRNLGFLKNNAPYDPDALLSTGNNLQGVDVFGMPANRSYGMNVKIRF